MSDEKLEMCKGEIDTLMNEIDPISENKEYKRLSSNIKKIEQELKKTLSEKQCELLEHLNDLWAESSCFSGALNFRLGFESSQFVNKIEKIGLQST